MVNISANMIFPRALFETATSTVSVTLFLSHCAYTSPTIATEQYDKRICLTFELIFVTVVAQSYGGKYIATRQNAAVDPNSGNVHWFHIAASNSELTPPHL